MFNTRSIRNIFPELEALATSEELHIIAVSKSWINTENRDFLAEYNLPSYSMFSCKRQTNNDGSVECECESDNNFLRMCFCCKKYNIKIISFLVCKVVRLKLAFTVSLNQTALQTKKNKLLRCYIFL